MTQLELIHKLRELGVKRAEVRGKSVLEVEFFNPPMPEVVGDPIAAEVMDDFTKMDQLEQRRKDAESLMYAHSR